MLYGLGAGYTVAVADFNLSGSHIPLLIRGIEAIDNKSYGALDRDNVISDVQSGALKNIVVLDKSSSPVGFVLYNVVKQRYDADKSLWVIGMYVDKNHNAVTPEINRFIKEIARVYGVKTVVGVSHRKGWARRMKPDMVSSMGIWHV